MMVRADLIDSEGNALVGQDFANDEDVIHYNTSTIDGVTAYNISAIPRLNWEGPSWKSRPLRQAVHQM